jgi:hypothetical protein
LTYTWRKLNKELALLPEEKVWELLQAELVGQKRLAILERLHQRYTALRAARERIEIMKQAKAL